MKPRILIVDDDQNFAQSCSEYLTVVGYNSDTCSGAEDAYQMLNTTMYDIVICDIVMPFRGQREGGLLLARNLTERYPTSSIILCSGLVTEDWITMLGDLRNFEFVAKASDYLRELKEAIQKIVDAKYCFVCIPFKEQFDDIYELGIKPVMEELGFACERCDEIQHNKGILEVIYERIRKAHIVIGDMTGLNPNVYYEIGYAHALNKQVVLLTQEIQDIPFDLRGYNHINYGAKITFLKRQLKARIEGLYKPNET